jgi:hypothetical protein
MEAGEIMTQKATIPSNVYTTYYSAPSLKTEEIFHLREDNNHIYVQHIYSWKWLTGYDWNDPDTFHLTKWWRIRKCALY